MQAQVAALDILLAWLSVNQDGTLSPGGYEKPRDRKKPLDVPYSSALPPSSVYGLYVIDLGCSLLAISSGNFR